MKKEEGFYFLQLTIYQYDKNKIKMDYSVMPVSFKEVDYEGMPTILKSEVSDETIDIKKMLFTEDFVYKDYYKTVSYSDCTMLCGEIHDKKKEGKAIKTSILVYSPHGLEKENVMKGWLKKLFKGRWFYKFKYLKFLKKKESLNQF